MNEDVISYLELRAGDGEIDVASYTFSLTQGQIFDTCRARGRVNVTSVSRSVCFLILKLGLYEP